MLQKRSAADLLGRASPALRHFFSTTLVGASLIMVSLPSQADTLSDQPVSTLTFDGFRAATSGVTDGNSYDYGGFTWGSKWNGITLFDGNSAAKLDNNTGHSAVIRRTDGSDFIFSSADFGWASSDRNGAKVFVVLYDDNANVLWQSDRTNVSWPGYETMVSGYSGSIAAMGVGVDVSNENTYKLQMDNFSFKAMPAATTPTIPSPVPEPETNAMMALGLLTLAAAWRRKSAGDQRSA